VHALSTAGFEVWQSQLDEPVLTEITVDAQNKIYVGTTTKLCSLNPGGALSWSYPTGKLDGDLDTLPVIGADGTLYYAGGSGYLYAFQDP
jgi:outer membrane protein assembly factor BamB